MNSSLKLEISLQPSFSVFGVLSFGMREPSSWPRDGSEGLPRSNQVPPTRVPVIKKLKAVPANRALTARREGLVGKGWKF